MKKTFFLVLALLVPLATFASVKQLSPATKIWLERQQSQSQQIDDTTIEAFVSFSSPDALDKLERNGAKVNAVFDGFCTVSIPANAVGEASDIHGVNMIDISHRVHLLTDSVSSSTHARMVNEGVNLPQSYTGKGVVLGVVDTGIDFNHRAFLDSNLKNRIARVYMPHDNTGKPVEGLPGSEYAGDDILNLKYDAKETHGTHTTGIAGGSIVNAYRGMAPDAELVLCALGDELTEVNVVNGVQYIAQYAASVGKPCVINLSLGNHDGPHDGNGFMSRAFDEIAQRYRNVIIVLAAGNEGYAPLYMRKTISGSQTLATILSDSEAEVDAWSNNTKPFGVKILLYNSSNPAIVYTTDCLKADTTFNLNTNDYFAQAVRSGKLSVSFGKNDVTGHTRIYLTSDMRMKSPYKI
ncbi:MAG: S8 family serine peptidase, partial [Bacteroidales bacterium]|nr:S8 family serine peptidase [Bacteroidales bacterium]